MTTVNNIYPEHFNHILSSIISETLNNVKLHPVRYENMYEPITSYNISSIESRLDDTLNDIERGYFDDEDDEEENQDNGEGGDIEPTDYTRIKKDIIDLITEKGWDTPIVDGISQMTYSSDQIGNTDNRGGGCGYAGFTTDDFVYNKNIDNVLTLKDVIDGCYRMKGSKYDYHYELFCDVTCDITGGTIRLEPSFDYGS